MGGGVKEREGEKLREQERREGADTSSQRGRRRQGDGKGEETRTLQLLGLRTI